MLATGGLNENRGDESDKSEFEIQKTDIVSLIKKQAVPNEFRRVLFDQTHADLNFK